jgi:hypothetical protein
MRPLVALAFCTAGVVIAAAPPTPIAPGGRPTDPPAAPALAKRVRELVGELGDDSFARREAAHAALLRLGPGVVPALDALGPQEDPEVRDRLRRVCRALAGYREDILGLLAAMPEARGDAGSPLAAAMSRVIAGHQPRSGDFLLSLVAAPESRLRRRAVHAFAYSWGGMTPEQVEAYVRRALTLRAHPRKRYPQGEDVFIRMGYESADGWDGWPPAGGFDLATRTTHFLDGRPVGEPFAYRGPNACTGWVGTKNLPVGRHSCSLELEYAFAHRGVKRSGVIRSRPFAFAVVAPGSFEALAAPEDAATERLVRGAVRFAQELSDFDGKPESLVMARPGVKAVPQQQVTWRGPGGESGGLSAPWWGIDGSLPVDLCFDVALHAQKGGKVYPCSPIVLLRGKTQKGYVMPKDVAGFARDNAGETAVRVVLTPSRTLAITTPEVTRYYGGSITSGVLKVKCTGPAK